MARIGDRRFHGRGNNVPGRARGKDNYLDKRKEGQFAPKPASPASDFATGASPMRPSTPANVPNIAKPVAGPKRTMNKPRVRKAA